MKFTYKFGVSEDDEHGARDLFMYLEHKDTLIWKCLFRIFYMFDTTHNEFEKFIEAIKLGTKESQHLILHESIVPSDTYTHFKLKSNNTLKIWCDSDSDDDSHGKCIMGTYIDLNDKHNKRRVLEVMAILSEFDLQDSQKHKFLRSPGPTIVNPKDHVFW
jgi:hypothetical protein